MSMALFFASDSSLSMAYRYQRELYIFDYFDRKVPSLTFPWVGVSQHTLYLFQVLVTTSAPNEEQSSTDFKSNKLNCSLRII